MIAGERLLEVERRRRHAERTKNPGRHRLVVRGAKLEGRERHVAAEKTGGRGERVRVLEHLTKFARRLDRRERLQGGFGRDALVLEQPLVVLARQSGARADQMLDEHATRGVGIAELERR